MAPRKAAKHSNTEIVDRAEEAGDASPPKRKKNVAKTGVIKNEEERQTRLPRAAKTAAKTEQIETTNAESAATTKNVKTKAKATTVKNAKTGSKTKSTTAKKNKGIEEKADLNVLGEESVKNIEEADTKKTRTKAAMKKAGMDVPEECTYSEIFIKTSCY